MSESNTTDKPNRAIGRVAVVAFTFGWIVRGYLEAKYGD